MEKENTATTETADTNHSSTEATAIAGETKEISGPVAEATEEAETQTSMTDQVRDKIMEVAAPVTAAAAAAGAAVAGFMSSGSTTDDGGKLARETAPIPGTFPVTPAVEKTESAATTEPTADEVTKADHEPVHEVIPSSTTEKSAAVDEDPETKAFGTGAEATDAGAFAAALAADAKANTPPTHIPSSSQMEAAPETVKDDTYTILPVPSETAPRGTKPLAESTYKDSTSKTGYIESPAPEPVKETSLPPTTEPEATAVTTESNLISSIATTQETEQLKSEALESSEPAAETSAKAAHIESAIVSDDTQMDKATIEALGESGNAVVTSAPITESAPTDDGVQEVRPLETAIVTDGGKESTTFKEERLENGKTQIPEGVSADLNQQQPPATPEKKMTDKGPATPAKDIPTKTPVSLSSASTSKESKRVSGVPSEAGSESKKKKGGFLRKLKKAFS